MGIIINILNMKTILALVASAAAVSLNDAPPAFAEPVWKQTWPSAAGLVQTSTQSPCQKFGVVGVTCESQLFAIGMEGDESLDKEILMKGQTYNYPQRQSLVQTTQAPFPQYEALAPEKVLVPQTTWARYRSTYY